MVVLTPDQLQQFLSALPDPQAPSGSGKKCPYTPWKRERDRALLCMIAGAGLKPAEAIGMTVDEFDATPMLGGEHDGYFRLSLKPAGKHPTSFGHAAYLDPALAPDILTWLRARRLLRIEGELLFPSTRTGKALSQATVYLLTKKTFERAGIAVMRSGGRTLRNSYAVREIQRAVDKHELKAMLGLALEHSTQLYFDAARRIDHAAHRAPAKKKE
jgi:integrase